MKNPFKREHTSKDQPSQAPATPQAARLKDMTDVDLEYIQGGKQRPNGTRTGQRAVSWDVRANGPIMN
jgi:hypothetical protein